MSNTTTGGESIRKVTGHQSRLILAVVCAVSVFGVASVQANGNGVNNGTTVTHTKEHFNDQPIDDTNKCNGHDVTGQGTLVVEETQKVSPTRYESRFKITRQGKVHWVLDPNERYQYFGLDEQYERSSTPQWTTTSEMRRHIVRVGGHRHGNRDCDDDHGKGRRPKGDSWFFYERVTTSSSGTSSTKTKDECK